MLQNGNFAVNLQVALEMGSAIRLPVILAHLEDLRRTQADPDDPIEGMLLEKIYLLHQLGPHVHARAADAADNADAAARLTAAACRIDAEMARLVEALATHRTSQARLRARNRATSKAATK